MAGSLQRYDPHNSLSRLEPMRGFSNMFELLDFMRPSRLFGDDHLRIDVDEREDAYLVKAEMPGIKKEDIKVAINGDQVSISGERSGEQERKEGNSVCRERFQGSQYRSFTLPQYIDDEKATATCVNGILELTLPKKAGAGARQLTVQ